MAIAAATVNRHRSARPVRNRTPAASSVRSCGAVRSGGGSTTRIRHRHHAATRNVTASTTAIAPPPSHANSAAPASGATIRRLSRMVRSSAFASASSRYGTIEPSSACWPAPTRHSQQP
jgi:hypothetical protein